MNTSPNRELAVFSAALELPASERAAYLQGACADDPVLRLHVEALLGVHEKAITFLETPAHGLDASALEGEVAGATARLSGSPAEKVGDRIGRYKLLQQIGEGGCGVVYLAEQEEPVRRRVALKVIKLGMDTKQIIARFEAERQALALMDHPNIAKVFDAGAAETGRPYFVMELVRGMKITDYCDENKLSTRERLALFVQVCQAIQHAHQKGIIHRDIKPSNILVTISEPGAPGSPKVIDFGIAKATQGRLTDRTFFTAFEQFIGTPAYMSPEQAVLTSLDVDTRSDIYSLGVLLYELLTGRTPFDQKELLAAGLDEMRRTIREQEPTKPSTRLSTMLAADLSAAARHRKCEASKLTSSIRGDLDWMVMKCLEKDRTRRYETANGLAYDIQRHLNNEPVVARPPSRYYRLEKAVRRNKGAFAAITAISIVLLVGTVVSSWQAVRATRSEREQTRLREAAQQAQASEAGLRQTAQREAGRAEAAAVDLKTTLSSADFLQAVGLIAGGNRRDALPFLGRSLSANPSNDAALTRLTTLLTYHVWMTPGLVLNQKGGVTSAQFSSDRKRILVVAGTNACVWDAQTGRPVTESMKHRLKIESAQFSLDGKRIVTASYDKTARIWDAQTGQPLTDPMAHGTAVESAQFSLDGRRVLTTSFDAKARVWDALTGEPLSEPMKHVYIKNTSPDAPRNVYSVNVVGNANLGNGRTESFSRMVMSAQFRADGKRILTTGDKTVVVWDVEKGEPLTKPLEHGSTVLAAQFSPDGNRIVTVSMDAVGLWDAETGQPLAEPIKQTSQVSSAKFSTDGRRIVTASLDRIERVWDAQTGQPLTDGINRGIYPSSVDLSPDGKRVVTFWGDTVQVWDAKAGQALTATTRPARSAQFNPDGKRIVTASNYKDAHVWTARVWDAQTGQPLTEPMTHGSNVVSAQFSPDGKRIVTASDDKTARIWDAQTGRPLTEPMKHGTNRVDSAQFSPDGKRIVTTSADKTARVWDAQTGELLTEPMSHHINTPKAQFSPDGKRIVTTDDFKVRVWDVESGELMPSVILNGNVRSLQFSSDGKRIVTASLGTNAARVWDAQTGQPLTEPMKHGGGVLSAQFSPDGQRIVTASSDKTARVWDAQTGQPLAEPMKHGGQVLSAQFSPDGKRIVTASEDTTARIWDAQTGQPLTETLKHPASVLSAKFSSDGKRVLTISDGAARIWDVGPTQAKIPDWLLPLSEALSGEVLNKQGVLEPTKLNRFETLEEIRQNLKQATNDDDWITWGRWLLADRATRTISPFSKITVPEYIENRIKERTPKSLDEAEQLATDQPEVLQRISEARATLKQTKE